MPVTPASWYSTFLGDFWGFLDNWFSKFWFFIRDFGLALWAFLVALVGIAWAIVTHIVPMLTLVLNVLSGLVTGDWHFAPPAALSTALQIANTFFPVDTFMGLTIAYMTLTIALATYRMVKSWIPTESGA